MVVLIEFVDRETEVKGLAVLIGRFSGKVLRGGLHMVPVAALEAPCVAEYPLCGKGHSQL